MSSLSPRKGLFVQAALFDSTQDERRIIFAILLLCGQDLILEVQAIAEASKLSEEAVRAVVQRLDAVRVMNGPYAGVVTIDGQQRSLELCQVLNPIDIARILLPFNDYFGTPEAG